MFEDPQIIKQSMKSGESDRGSQILIEIEATYSEWGPKLLRFAMRLCGNRDDAEDIVVETFTHAYRSWDSFRGSGSRLSWLYGIAINRHSMNRRKQRKRQEKLTDEIPATATNTIDRIAIEQAVTRLPLSQRQSFLLVKSEGLTAREASEILRRPIGTVLYEIHQAVHTLRAELIGKELDFTIQPRLCEAEP